MFLQLLHLSFRSSLDAVFEGDFFCSKIIRNQIMPQVSVVFVGQLWMFLLPKLHLSANGLPWWFETPGGFEFFWDPLLKRNSPRLLDD